MKKFEGIYLASDLDGTLLNKERKIPKANLDAIEYFMQNGGTFGVATGRARQGIEIFMDILPGNAPAILLNGAHICDLDNDKTIEITGMPANTRKVLEELMALSDKFGVEVYLEDKILLCRNSEVSQHHFKIIDAPFEIHELSDIPSCEHWGKINLTGQKEDLLPIHEYLKENYNDEFTFMFSTANYFEIVNPLISKGNTVMKIAKMLGIDKKNVYTVGDNHNDISMLEQAHIGFAPSSGEPEVTEIADVVLCDNNTGCVAEAIMYIEKNLEKLA